MDSGEGRTKHRQRRWRIFSRVWLSMRLWDLVSGALAGGAGDVLGQVDFMAEQS